MDDKRRTTTKDIALLLQLRDSKQLNLAPEFQRNSVWPRPAKAYLIDTILTDRPIPLLFFSRSVNAQTGRPEYEVIDGQQRLRAVFEFFDNRFSLTESATGSPWKGKRWNGLDERSRQKLLNYDFVVEELSGYGQADIRDMFQRMNRYVVRLNAQEQRHAVTEGQFKDFAEEIGTWPYWLTNKIFSKGAQTRMRIDEFAAELVILLLEGPQDKKKTLELYFEGYKETFVLKDDVRRRLLDYTKFIESALPELQKMQLRRPSNFYALVGALEAITNQGERLNALSAKSVGASLQSFDRSIQSANPTALASRYVRAASSQTDNIGPRQARIDVLTDVLNGAS